MTRTVLPHWQSEQTPKTGGAAPELRSLTPAQRYEARKHIWKALNPGATPAEYEAAMQELARKSGV